MNSAPGIRVSGTHYIGANKLFGPIDLLIPSGQWTCLLGPSGVGKSTILRLIAGLETGGNFDGDISATDNQLLPQRLSYMAQSDLLFPWLDVTDNVTIGARLRNDKPDMAKARALIERVGLAEHVHKKPPALSGGMRQRAALARTLMEDRPVVLLDEPFSALDARTRAEMQELAGELLHERTVLLVTHDPAEAARLGHQIVLMNETHDGAELLDMPPPPTPPVRAIDDAHTLLCQAALLKTLRGEDV